MTTREFTPTAADQAIIRTLRPGKTLPVPVRNAAGETTDWGPEATIVAVERLRGPVYAVLLVDPDGFYVVAKYDLHAGMVGAILSDHFNDFAAAAAEFARWAV